MSKTSTKHAFLCFHCIDTLYYLLYKWTTATFYVSLPIVIRYTKYNIVCGIVSCNLPCISPIIIYKYFILKIDLHRSGTQKELFICFFKLVTLYLNTTSTLRNRTNRGIVLFWYYIGIYVLISIFISRSS